VLLPALQASRGRVVFVNAAAGLHTVPVPPADDVSCHRLPPHIVEGVLDQHVDRVEGGRPMRGRHWDA